MFERSIKQFAPRPRQRSLPWMCGNIKTPDKGRPFDHGEYPHLGAPGGPCDAVDDPRVRKIWLQWGSRLGKTFFGQSMHLYFADTDPGLGMFAGVDEKLALEVVARTYGMLQRCPPLADQLLPKHLRNDDRIDLRHCKIYVAWSRSVSTLADKDVKYGHGGEISKWVHSKTSTEADPLKLFTDRSKNCPAHKFVLESTPTIKGKCRVEKGLLGSSHCRFYVPCPHCRHYQTLALGNEGVPGGLRWQKNDAGKSNKDLARATAWYECSACSGRIEDHHRRGMMRRGVWCPEGCKVIDEQAWLVTEGQGVLSEDYKWEGWAKASWVEGTPANGGVDAGYQLSSFVALALSWGECAAEFVGSKDKPQDFRNFVNQWLAETWSVVQHKQTWEKLGAKLIVAGLRRGVVPEWGSLVTCAVDRQEEFFVYDVEAWGPGRRSHTVQYGDAGTLDEIRGTILQHPFEHADGGPPLRPAFTLVDSGYRPDGVYEFSRDCTRKHGLQVWPCKGANTSLNADYRESVLGKETSMPGMILFWIDTIRTQLWIENQLHQLGPDDEGRASLYEGTLEEHQDFLEQLLNDAAETELDSHNNARDSWNRVNVNIPNDLRDTKRYNYAGMIKHTRGAPIRPRVKTLPPPRAAMPLATRPDGRPFIPGGR